jgi:hypothetical protein
MSREAATAVETHQAGHAGGAVTSVLDRVRQAYCGLHGHDNLLQFERDRMFLKCVSCGHESTGWEISDTPPATVAGRVAVARKEAPRPALRPHLVDARRIA